MARILVVEDDLNLQEVVKYNLVQAGHEPLVAARAEDALKLARDRHPELILLDLMLPDLPGTEVCKRLKNDAATKHIPIMMLTAKGEEIDRIVGFELGADDYVQKPFSVRELMLRIAAILRRREPNALPKTVDEFGSLQIDREAQRVWVNDIAVELTSLEFKLLVTLFDRRDRVQSRAVLLDCVWGVTAEIETRTVDTHVKRLREKLGAAGSYIETVRGTGYRFAAMPTESQS